MFRRKSIAMLMAVVMLLSAFNFMTLPSSAATTITVATATDLANLNTNIANATAPVTVNFTADIDMDGINYTSVNTTKRLLVHGNNHYINNLRTNQYGLFTKVGASSSITNLGLTNAYVTHFSATSKGYGLLLSIAGNNTTITGCFVHGSLAVYSAENSNAEAVGGMVGYFNGTMNNCFSVVDIHTDARMVGGLIGHYYAIDKEDSVSISYSTGTIDNKGREYIGGLIGKAECSCLHQCYTSMQIKNTYTDYVRSIGVVPDLDPYVFYDENVCYQRQDENDEEHRFNGKYSSVFPSADLWVYSDTYYPQIAYFYNNTTNNVFKNISAISAAKVYLNNAVYGREHMPLSTKTAYQTATVTSNTGTDNNKIQWHITGGVDEYFYPGQSYTINEGKIDGLSGNTYDSESGKYIFTTAADVVFTAVSGKFERNITVHVTDSSTTPYTFSGGGAGTSASPYLIKTPADLDLIRFYCINDINGELYYKINNSLDLSNDNNTKEWYSIYAFKGHILGNKKDILNLNITKPTALGGDAGFIGSITGNTTIDGLYIAGANIYPANNCINAGLLAGSSYNAQISNCAVSGLISGARNAGGLIGYATDTDVNACIVSGAAFASEYAGGLIGIADDSGVTIIDTLTAVTCMNASLMAGMIAKSSGASITTSLSNSILYTQNDNGKAGLYNGTASVSYSYFYDNGAMIYGDEHGKTRAELMATDAKDTLFNDHGSSMWTRSSTTASNSICPIPNLNKSSMKYLADNLVYYTADIGTPCLYNFKYCKMQGGYLTAQSVDGYSVYGEEDNNYEPNAAWESSDGYINTFENKNGGKELFLLKKRGTSNHDVRYLIFDVPTIKVVYKNKISLDSDVNEYLDDMTNTSLLSFTDADDVNYNFILDINESDLDVYKELPIKLVSMKDSLKIKVTLPETKYAYTITAFTDEEETQKIAPIDTDTFAIEDMVDPDSGRYSMYINISITQKVLPWGIYNIDCN
ncbi:MAG: hypothetical protein E7591_06605 [Ruminococcaceae bacterium]|nr:hypothetical protein [Oscillospiraceae bacterium]